MEKREQEIRAEERARMIASLSELLEESADKLGDRIAELMVPVIAARDRAESTLREIGRGLPRQDEWRSAASFMEYVAEILERENVPRPDHYENEDDWR